MTIEQIRRAIVMRKQKRPARSASLWEVWGGYLTPSLRASVAR